MMLRIGALVIVVLVGLLLFSPPAARDATGDVAQPASRKPPSDNAKARTARADASVLTARDSSRSADLFGPKAKPIVRAAPPAAAEPAPPPSLPFRYVGRYTEGESMMVFLSANDRSFLSKAGDVLDGAFKLESIDDKQILFTHLPSNQSLTLSMGEPGK